MTRNMGDGSIDPDKLRELVARIDTMKADMDDARSEMGSLYKHAEDDLGINRMALKQAIKLKNMEALKRSDWLRSFQSYCHILGVDAQAELDLVQGGAGEDNAGGEDSGGEDGAGEDAREAA